MKRQNQPKPPTFKTKEDELSFAIIGAAIEVQRTLGGPGLLEAVYEEALVWELDHRGFIVERQKQVPILYKGQKLKTPLKVDILVENRLIIEVKAVEVYNEIFEAQTLTYLRLLGLKLGLVINFGAPTVRIGTKRVANGL